MRHTLYKLSRYGIINDHIFSHHYTNEILSEEQVLILLSKVFLKIKLVMSFSIQEVVLCPW